MNNLIPKFVSLLQGQAVYSICEFERNLLLLFSGYKMLGPVCRNRVTGEEADEKLCNLSQKPIPKTIVCNTHRCPPR